ncbi:MAG: biotin transporter BioY [Acetatifactor sp.]|nr:biotin transporter BioY [Acetatifactor sp.]
MDMDKKKIDVKQMTLIGLMTAVICVIAPFSLNIPISPVPISLGTMAIYFVITVLGMWRGTISVLLYILLGLVGLPVFTNFSGGAGKVLGPTGGYIVGYVFLALIFGFFTEHWKGKIVMNVIGGVLGTTVMYFFGTLWLAYLNHMSFMAALWAGVIPYIPGDIVKLAVSMGIGTQLRKRLVKAGLL